MKIDSGQLDAATVAYLEQTEAAEGFFGLRTAAGRIEVLLATGTGKPVEDVPPAIHTALVNAARRADSGASTLYEFSKAAAAKAGPPKRQDYPDNAEGSQRYARAYGTWVAANRAANESAGLPPDSRKTMTRAEFDALDVMSKRQVVREKVRLVD